MFAAGIEAMHTRVAVSVRHEDGAGTGHGHACGLVERRAGAFDGSHPFENIEPGTVTGVRWLVRLPQRHELFAAGGEPVNHVPVIIRAVDTAVRGQATAVRPPEPAFTPAGQLAPGGIQNDNRMAAAVEHIDPVLGIDRKTHHVHERIRTLRLGPIRHQLVPVRAIAV